jgi:hypothetical protein
VSQSLHHIALLQHCLGVFHSRKSGKEEERERGREGGRKKEGRKEGRGKEGRKKERGREKQRKEGRKKKGIKEGRKEEKKERERKKERKRKGIQYYLSHTSSPAALMCTVASLFYNVLSLETFILLLFYRKALLNTT